METKQYQRTGERVVIYAPQGTTDKLNTVADRIAKQTGGTFTLSHAVRQAILEYLERQGITK